MEVYTVSSYTYHIFTGDSGSFEKIHLHSHQRNLRTVIVNRRDYYGSTKYTDAELDDLNHGRKVFFDRLAIQMAYFIKHLVDEGIPKISSDRAGGGVAVMGWSIGAVTMLALFSDAGLLSSSLYKELQCYVKDFIIYDAPASAFGYTLPDGEQAYRPWNDPEFKTWEERENGFGIWVSSYFDQHDLSTGQVDRLDTRKRTDRNTFDRFSQTELSRFFDREAGARSEPQM